MGKKKLEVIKIAIRLLAENGYHSTSVEEIAKESGMAKGSFYKYYSSKEDLLLDIINITPVEIKQVLTKISLKEYDSPEQKLSDLIFMCYENVLVNHIQILVSSLFDGPLIKNKNIHEAARNVSIEMDHLISEFFIDIYGEEIGDYVWNLNVLFKSLIMNYLVLNREKLLNMDVKETSSFLGMSIDILANGYLEKKPKALLVGKFPKGNELSDQSPLVKGKKIRQILKKMTETVYNSIYGSKEKEDYLKVISLLEEELLQGKQNSILIKAYILSIESTSNLEKECTKLRELLEIV